jgi:hypothetical protein
VSSLESDLLARRRMTGRDKRRYDATSSPCSIVIIIIVP